MPDGGTLKVCGKTEIREHPGAFKVQKEVRVLEPRKGESCGTGYGRREGQRLVGPGGLVRILGFALRGTGRE